ncbi:MAG TPA: hypothetical protein VFQ35_06335 [Polyangiaceae bacterium]|nr:hypothetical protein [Polyangiaceae bacterium]
MFLRSARNTKPPTTGVRTQHLDGTRRDCVLTSDFDELERLRAHFPTVRLVAV